MPKEYPQQLPEYSESWNYHAGNYRDGKYGYVMRQHDVTKEWHVFNPAGEIIAVSTRWYTALLWMLEKRNNS